MFDWQDLRHFAALARERSLSGAARRLAVDHATVGRRISALETALGLKLVDRRPRAYVLTAEGERIAALATRMEADAFAIARAARAVKPGLAGEVSVSAPPALTSALIAPRLGEFRNKYPNVRLRLIAEKRTASLSRREADLAIRLSRPSETSLVARRVGSMPFALYAARDYVAQTSAADFAFIGYDEGLDHVPQQHWLMAVAGARPVVLRTNDIEAQRAAARAGVGVAALPRFLGDGDDELQFVAASVQPVARDVWLLVHADLRRTQPVRAVMDYLAAILARNDGGTRRPAP